MDCNGVRRLYVYNLENWLLLDRLHELRSCNDYLSLQ